LCTKLDDYNEPESKASIIWIIGEYAEKINEAEAIIERFTESFIEDHDRVKLALLTAAVKLYLKKPDEGESII
jgi:AP-1 complex subunit beta-1